MYRYSVDNAITYAPEDFVLFRDSPFACWMERLTLENPEHGIPTDAGSKPPGSTVERQDDLGETLRAEGKDVTVVDWDLEESLRRSATLEAMRRGADFIVNGQLALGPLSGTANLLMRTSGYSELGDYLYIPCDTQAAASTRNAAFRLCFLADLLHSLQGQLPPQLLLIRGDSDLVPLPTEDHIYHYRAVKQRFMEAMRSFRKHRMPDPAESAHFGRWSDCANEVLKQRALRAEGREEPGSIELEIPLRQAAGAGYVTRAPRDRELPPGTGAAGESAAPPSRTVDSPAGGSTLAEQARMLKPGTYVIRRPQSPVLAGRFATLSQDPPRDAPNSRRSHRGADAALQNLEFIGSSQRKHSIGMGPPATDSRHDADAGLARSAPPPSLRGSIAAGRPSPADPLAAPPGHNADEERTRFALTPEPDPSRAAASPRLRPLDIPESGAHASSVVDLDTTAPASPGRADTTPPRGFEAQRRDIPLPEGGEQAPVTLPGLSATEHRKPPPFSSLITNTEFEE
jgi:hypothetical protein